MQHQHRRPAAMVMDIGAVATCLHELADFRVLAHAVSPPKLASKFNRNSTASIARARPKLEIDLWTAGQFSLGFKHITQTGVHADRASL